MGYIDNEKLKRELANNYEIHEIFEHQRYQTLEETKKEIQQIDLNNILLEINIDNITNYYKHRINLKFGSIENLAFWNHIVSLCFMKQLKEKYNIETDHDLDEEEKIITQGSFEEYLCVQEILVNRDDVFNAIDSLNMGNVRLHIILRCWGNENICNELSNYLQDNLPFITMIYTDSCLNLFKVMLDNGEQCISEDIYKYKIFDGYKEGRSTQPVKHNKKPLQKKYPST